MIFLKLKWQVKRALNIREKDIQRQIKPILNPCKDSLNGVMDINIDDEISNKSNPLEQLKLSKFKKRFEKPNSQLIFV